MLQALDSSYREHEDTGRGLFPLVTIHSTSTSCRSHSSSPETSPSSPYTDRDNPDDDEDDEDEDDEDCEGFLAPPHTVRGSSPRPVYGINRSAPDRSVSLVDELALMLSTEQQNQSTDSSDTSETSHPVAVSASVSAVSSAESVQPGSTMRWLRDQQSKGNIPSDSTLHNILVVMLYYGIGLLFYKYNQEWTVLQCVYFTTVSMTTVGYGDITPDTDGSRVFTMIYILVGIVFVVQILIDWAYALLDYIQDKFIYSRHDKTSTPLSVLQRERIILCVIITLMCITVGTAFMCVHEGLSVVSGIYWSVVTTLSIGYGDLIPEKDTSRLFNVFYVLASVLIVTAAIGTFSSVQREKAFEEKRMAMLNKPLDAASILTMQGEAEGGEVDRLNFLIAMLVHTNGLNKEKDIDPWLQRFVELDKDGSGNLDENDLHIFAAEEAYKTRIQVARLAEQINEKEQTLSRTFSRSLSQPMNTNNSATKKRPSLVGRIVLMSSPRAQDTHCEESNMKPAKNKKRLSEQSLKELLKKYSTEHGIKDPVTLCVLNNLGVYYYDKGLLEEAEKCFSVCLGHRSECLGVHHVDALTSMFNLANCFTKQGRYSEAEEMYMKCLVGREVTLGETHDDTLAVISNIAYVYMELEQPDVARALYEMVVDERRKRTPSKDGDCENTVVRQGMSMDLIKALFNLGVFYAETGKFRESLSVMQECYHMSVTLFGNQHRASERVLKVLRNVQERISHWSKRTSMWPSVYSTEDLKQQDKERIAATLSAPSKVLHGGVIRDPDSWIDEALYGPAKVPHSTENPFAYRKQRRLTRVAKDHY